MIKKDENLIIVGSTKDEMGGSEYYEYIHGIIGGNVPKVDPKQDRVITQTMLNLIRNDLLTAVHDCSKGGLSVAVAEMCILSGIGAAIDLSKIPKECSRTDHLLFSESHSRFVLSVKNDKLSMVMDMLESSKLPYGIMGKVHGNSIIFSKNDATVNISVDKAEDAWVNTLEGLLEHG